MTSPDAETTADLRLYRARGPVSGSFRTLAAPADGDSSTDVIAAQVAAREQLRRLSEIADEVDEHALAPTTKRYYEADWALWEHWCAKVGCSPLPVEPETVRLYVIEMATAMREDGTPAFRVSTIERRLSALGYVNRMAGHSGEIARHPRVARTIAATKRIRQEQVTRKRPLLLDDVVRFVEAMDHGTWPDGVTAARDTFAILLGFTSAMRRSEIAALRAGQVVLHPLDGLHIRLGKSKADQEGRGALVAVPYGSRTVTCLPCAWVRWTRLMAAPTRGQRMRLVQQNGGAIGEWQHVCRGVLPEIDPSAPLLRTLTKAGEIGNRAPTDAALNKALKRRAVDAGYDPDVLGMHSLRAGFVTQARRNGADPRSVRMQTRHGSDAMVDVYDREYLPLEGNAVQVLGL